MTLSPSPELKQVARGLSWWEPPETALADPWRFLAQVMTLGTRKRLSSAASEVQDIPDLRPLPGGSLPMVAG